METVTLTIKTQPVLFLEADNISPDVFAGKTAAEIAALHAYEGREQTTIGKYFEVSGNAGATAAGTRIVVKGDVSRIKYIGMKMTAGEVVIEKSPDMYTGAWMQGGKLLVRGSTNAFTGIGMKAASWSLKVIPATTWAPRTAVTGGGCRAAPSGSRAMPGPTPVTS